MKKIKNVFIIAILAVLGFSMVSCENENIDTPASVSEVNGSFVGTRHWSESNMQGYPSDFLSKPYTWKNCGEMNIKFWEEHQKTLYEQLVIMLKKSHDEVMNIIHSFSDAELFTKKYFDWTGATSLGSYCISATSSHYDWAIKKLKKTSEVSLVI